MARLTELRIPASGPARMTLTDDDVAAIQRASYASATVDGRSEESSLTVWSTRSDRATLAVPSLIKSLDDSPMMTDDGKWLGDSFLTLSRLPGHGGVTTVVNTIFDELLAGDAISLVWWPDGETNEYLKRAGLHAGLLEIDVQRSVRHLIFRLETKITPDGPGRLIRKIQAEPAERTLRLVSSGDRP